MIEFTPGPLDCFTECTLTDIACGETASHYSGGVTAFAGVPEIPAHTACEDWLPLIVPEAVPGGLLVSAGNGASTFLRMDPGIDSFHAEADASTAWQVLCETGSPTLEQFGAGPVDIACPDALVAIRYVSTGGDQSADLSGISVPEPGLTLALIFGALGIRFFRPPHPPQPKGETE